MGIKKYLDYEWCCQWDTTSWPVCWVKIYLPRLNKVIVPFYFRYRPLSYRKKKKLPAFVIDGPKSGVIVWTYKWKNTWSPVSLWIEEFVSHAPASVCRNVKI